MVMENQIERRNIAEALMNAFQYAFVETAPYRFFVPTKDQYVAVQLKNKVYHCLCCEKTVEVNYNQTGVVYFSKARYEKQREIYARRDLVFPGNHQVEGKQPFTCHDEGYCAECAERELRAKEQGQEIYNLCLALRHWDEAVLSQAREIMDGKVKDWIMTLAESSQLSGYDLSSFAALKDLICAVILRDVKELDRCLAAYRRGVQERIAEVEALLAAMPAQWDAYTARPVATYESMSDEFYHEYTVVFPVKETVARDFYVLKSIDARRVRIFLEQARVQSTAELIVEAGFKDAWVDWFIDRVTALEK